MRNILVLTDLTYALDFAMQPAKPMKANVQGSI